MIFTNCPCVLFFLLLLLLNLVERSETNNRNTNTLGSALKYNFYEPLYFIWPWCNTHEMLMALIIAQYTSACFYLCYTLVSIACSAVGRHEVVITCDGIEVSVPLQCSFSGGPFKIFCLKFFVWLCTISVCTVSFYVWLTLTHMWEGYLHRDKSAFSPVPLPCTFVSASY